MSEELSSSEEFPKRKFRKKEEALWITTMSDLSFLLLCFFVLLYSMANIDKKKYENVREAVKKDVETKSDLKTMSEDILAEIKKNKLDATVLFDADGVTLELRDKILFRSGAANLSSEYRPITDRLLSVLAKSAHYYKLSFEGHTDDEPLGANAEFKSNWELSGARALSMLREMNRRGVSEDRMSIVAYAHTRPKVPYDGKSGGELRAARDANRRVVIRIQ